MAEKCFVLSQKSWPGLQGGVCSIPPSRELLLGATMLCPGSCYLNIKRSEILSLKPRGLVPIQHLLSKAGKSVLVWGGHRAPAPAAAPGRPG